MATVVEGIFPRKLFFIYFVVVVFVIISNFFHILKAFTHESVHIWIGSTRILDIYI